MELLVEKGRRFSDFSEYLKTLVNGVID